MKINCLAICSGVTLFAAVGHAADQIELNTTLPVVRNFANNFAAGIAVAPRPPTVADVANRLAPDLGLGIESRFTLVRETGIPAKVRHLHYEQSFRGVPIWGGRVVVSQELDKNQVVRVGGTLTSNVGKDVADVAAKLSPDDALNRAKQAPREGAPRRGFAPPAGPGSFSGERSRLVVYVRPADKVAKLSYEVTFLGELNPESGLPTRPIFLIDATNGEILHRYEGLTTLSGTGPGGNARTGQYRYGAGQVFPALDVADAGAGSCSLSNDFVETQNMNESTVDPTGAFKFPCFENTTKPINDGYAPMNDAQHVGTVVFGMWNDWFKARPISQKLIMRVHYGRRVEDAFWNGSAMYFGDGDTKFYPLVTLDVASHEIAHGYTEQHSDLKYENQSGAINEAFSDMAGEAAEFYADQSHAPDFLVGPKIFKQRDGALRFMCDPTKDGSSIASVKDYRDGLDVHYGSGVYNKAFCVLAKTNGWDTRKAFQVFQVANRDYWTPLSTFASGAVAVRDAARDLGYPVADVRAAFATVDINVP